MLVRLAIETYERSRTFVELCSITRYLFEQREPCFVCIRREASFDSCPRSLNFRSFTFAVLIFLTQISVGLSMKNYSSFINKYMYFSNNNFLNNFVHYLLID